LFVRLIIVSTSVFLTDDQSHRIGSVFYFAVELRCEFVYLFEGLGLFGLIELVRVIIAIDLDNNLVARCFVVIIIVVVVVVLASDFISVAFLFLEAQDAPVEFSAHHTLALLRCFVSFHL